MSVVIYISDDEDDTQLTQETVVAVSTKAQQKQSYVTPNTNAYPENDKPFKPTKKSPKVTNKISNPVSDEDSDDSSDDERPLRKRSKPSKRETTKTSRTIKSSCDSEDSGDSDDTPIKQLLKKRNERPKDGRKKEPKHGKRIASYYKPIKQTKKSPKVTNKISNPVSNEDSDDSSDDERPLRKRSKPSKRETTKTSRPRKSSCDFKDSGDSSDDDRDSEDSGDSDDTPINQLLKKRNERSKDGRKKEPEHGKRIARFMPATHPPSAACALIKKFAWEVRLDAGWAPFGNADADMLEARYLSASRSTVTVMVSGVGYSADVKAMTQISPSKSSVRPIRRLGDFDWEHQAGPRWVPYSAPAAVAIERAHAARMEALLGGGVAEARAELSLGGEAFVVDNAHLIGSLFGIESD